jgi:hypothetical protein
MADGTVDGCRGEGGTVNAHASGELSAAEASDVNTRLDADIRAAARKVRVGAELAAAGVTTVSLDEHGRMVEHRPDGGTTVLPGA